MSVIGKVHYKMFGLRWLVEYNHSFLRNGKEKMSQVFRDMEINECNQDVEKGEQVFVKGSLDNLSNFKVENDFYAEGFDSDSNEEEHNITFPPNTPTPFEKCVARKVLYWTQEGIPIVRGETIPVIPIMMDDECNVYDDSGYESNGDEKEHFRTSFSQEVLNMFEQDHIHTQASQQETAEAMGGMHETKDQHMMALMREGLKLTENNKEMYTKYEELVQGAVNTMRKMAVDQKTSDEKSSDCMAMVETGKSKTRVEKRKRNSFS